MAEEINGVLSHTLGVREVLEPIPPVFQEEVEIEPPQISLVKETTPGPEETKVVIHTSPENSVKRKQSIDSVDLMIEEEIKNITDDHPFNGTVLEERLQTPTNKDSHEIEP